MQAPQERFSEECARPAQSTLKPMDFKRKSLLMIAGRQQTRNAIRFVFPSVGYCSANSGPCISIERKKQCFREIGS
jgi:hypothetical protein